METTTNDTGDSNKSKKKMGIIVGVVFLLIIIVVIIIIVVVVTADAKDEKETMTKSEATTRLNEITIEIINDCSILLAADTNNNCSDITDEQRTQIKEIFEAFNEDSDQSLSSLEFDSYLSQTANQEFIFDAIDINGDGTVSFKEMMASLMADKEIFATTYNNTYGPQIEDIYSYPINLSDPIWFEYATDLYFYSEFNDVYNGYNTGIVKKDYLDITTAESLNYFDTENDGGVDVEEFIDAFIGTGIEYIATQMNLTEIEKTAVNISQILESISLSLSEDELISSPNFTYNGSVDYTRRRLSESLNCRAEDEAISVACQKDQDDVNCGGNLLNEAACKKQNCIKKFRFKILARFACS